MLLLFITEHLSAAKMGTYKTTVTSVMTCYIGYTNLTGAYEVKSQWGFQLGGMTSEQFIIYKYCNSIRRLTGGC